ncbi:MAG: hypothetical protein V2I65_13925 [Paracoccaceae bacterium]|nr:hypothetical protein [Paracoccaceae bacterium]
MTTSVLRTIEAAATAMGTGLGRLLGRIARDRRDRKIERLKAHLSWHPVESRDRGPRARR